MSTNQLRKHDSFMNKTLKTMLQNGKSILWYQFLNVVTAFYLNKCRRF